MPRQRKMWGKHLYLEFPNNLKDPAYVDLCEKMGGLVAFEAAGFTSDRHFTMSLDAHTEKFWYCDTVTKNGKKTCGPVPYFKPRRFGGWVGMDGKKLRRTAEERAADEKNYCAAICLYYPHVVTMRKGKPYVKNHRIGWQEARWS